MSNSSGYKINKKLNLETMFLSDRSQGYIQKGGLGPDSEMPWMAAYIDFETVSN